MAHMGELPPQAVRAMNRG
jgi:hypothetical protein